MSTSVERSTSVKNISERAASYSMPGVTVDGNDFNSITQAVDTAVENARRGNGPSLIESLTYRWRGHSKSDRNRYRTKKEINEWIDRDPIVRFSSFLIEHSVLNADDIKKIEASVEAEIEAAIEFARSSPDPLVSDVSRDVYTEVQA
jgi:pyruvate dehydrogenase E1 component alpha subunit